MVNRPDSKMARITPPAYTEPVARVRNNPSTPASEVQAPAAPLPSDAPTESPSSTDKVRRLGVSDSAPVKISFQTPAASPNTIQGVRRLSTSENIMELPDLPDLRNPDDLGDSIDLYKLACTACEEGDKDMALDFLSWARELDPGVPDLPPTLFA